MVEKDVLGMQTARLTVGRMSGGRNAGGIKDEKMKFLLKGGKFQSIIHPFIFHFNISFLIFHF